MDGWEERLNAVIDDARRKPYRLGEHDCFRVACAAVQALTGADLWPMFAGSYSTRREALRYIAQYGDTFEAAATAFFAVPQSHVEMARRGDICAYQDERGEKHLGVCIGAKVAALGPEGVEWLSLRDCHAAWRIG